MTIGEQIKKFRKQNKMTQKKLSELSRIPVRTIQDYEADKCKPKVDKLERLAAALNVDIADIIIATGDDNGKLSEEYIKYWQYCITSKELDSQEIDSELRHKYDILQELEAQRQELSARLDAIKQQYNKDELLEIIVKNTDGVTVLNSKDRETKFYCLCEKNFSTDELINIMEYIQQIRLTKNPLE